MMLTQMQNGNFLSCLTWAKETSSFSHSQHKSFSEGNKTLVQQKMWLQSFLFVWGSNPRTENLTLLSGKLLYQKLGIFCWGMNLRTEIILLKYYISVGIEPKHRNFVENIIKKLIVCRGWNPNTVHAPKLSLKNHSAFADLPPQYVLVVRWVSRGFCRELYPNTDIKGVSLLKHVYTCLRFHRFPAMYVLVARWVS
jgi:hypothetical protein